jgi:hypothetical protein
MEGRTNLVGDPWQQLALPVVATNTVWSAQFNLPPDSQQGYFRLLTFPAAGKRNHEDDDAVET